MGIAFSIVALAMLTGNPIAGAILGVAKGTDGLRWWAAITYAGVSCPTVRVFPTKYLLEALRRTRFSVYDTVTHRFCAAKKNINAIVLLSYCVEQNLDM